MPDCISLGNRTFELYLAHDKIVEQIDALAARINADYEGLTAPVFMCVLNGAFMFASELMQRIRLDCEITFVKLNSYRGTRSTGEVSELIGLTGELRDRHVIIVEDIVDTGRSIEHIVKIVENHRPASVEVASLLIKPDVYDKDIEIRYVAIAVPNRFLVGFGLDCDGRGRNLPNLYAWK